MKILFKNVKRLEEESLIDQNVWVENGLICKPDSFDESTADQIIDGKGNLLIPGLVDVHVHLREPGGEAKETIATGTAAAAKGGFTTICAMPNTRPVPDTSQHMENVQAKIASDARVRVLPYASITKRQLGDELVDMKGLKHAGAFAFTDDGVGVQESRRMLEAMQTARSANGSIVAHCEDNSLTYNGVLHEGTKNQQLDMPGIPSACESVQIARDVLLAESADCHYHVCHVSTKESVRVIRDAKRAGIPVTTEVTPHHLLLTEDDIPGDNAMFKMNPPLRSDEDREALRTGLLDGTIDCIATDHAPHTAEDKKLGLLSAPFGITGLEIAFPLLYTYLVESGMFTLRQLVDWLTIRPADIFDLPYGVLEIDQPADLTLIDLNTEQNIAPQSFLSKGKNTPFDGWSVKGWPILTMVNGEIVWKEDHVYA
ncbi:dihydroorotase [Thalassobacillus sp. CUG 92003]|uniref:dihydroorotase n=1 Tax=Thalassobacillus sp. CUG 92003 TaxID=2736641 RepID=UPI0015E6A821|nr:dihydroorotase [Thalassobacillus sp. CUG 92003]